MVPCFSAHGYDERPAAWSPPAVVTDKMRLEAERAAQELKEALRPARQSDVELWLASLGSMTAGRKHDDDAEISIQATAAMLDDMPSAVFTGETLKKALRRFKWWPSFAELSEFLDAEKAPLVMQAKRLRAIAAHVDRDAESQSRGPRRIGGIG